jgi:hypothetical protein
MKKIRDIPKVKPSEVNPDEEQCTQYTPKIEPVKLKTQ